MQSARTKTAQLMAKAKLSTALSLNVPTAADKDIRILYNVLIYREKPENKLAGPFEVRNVDDKAVYVTINGKDTPFSVD